MFAARASDRAMVHPDKLTRREREIAECVYEGLGNQQVAERLFASKRTVESQIAHILIKLGVRSRVGVAAWVRDVKSRELARRSGRAFSHTTISKLLRDKPGKPPLRLDYVRGLVRGCNADPEEVRRWITAWRKVHQQ